MDKIHNLPDSLITIIKQSLLKLGVEPALCGDLFLDIPSDNRFGDLSTNAAMKISKVMRKPPRECAEILLELLKQRFVKWEYKAYLHDMKIEGAGFINFYLEDKYFSEHARQILVGGKKYLKQKSGAKTPVLIEFVSANPTGALSVAHARQAAVGDVLANILDFLGFRVKREYYLNDEGNQIAILGKSVELRLKEINGEKIEFPENYYQGEYIYDIAKMLKERGAAVPDVGEYAGDYILSIIRKELDDFGVHFDYWYSQKSLRREGLIEKSFAFLKKKGYLFEEDGAVWFKSSVFGDDKDRVVIKSDGAHTYLAPDIAYHRQKYKRGFKWLINLWGPDHHGYISRIKAAVQALGYDPTTLSVIIVQLATIFRDGKQIEMSTRKGQYITLREVLDEVGVDAARFFFLMRRTSSHLDFDLGIAKKQTAENPVYYIQYAHARISSILRNATFKSNPSGVRFELLRAKEEIALLKKIHEFGFILNICHKTLDPYMLTVYLQGLAEAFHKFYDAHRVLGQEKALSSARMSLIKAAQIVIAVGLELLGVSRPEQM
jgi:arginyl-tRNA synthetase